jgi:hypothetical protein
MKKSLLLLASFVALAACRESNTSVRSAPAATARPAVVKTLCFDSTFIESPQHPRSYSYTTEVVVGEEKTLAIPLRIDWTTVAVGGCPQVASLRVYRLGKELPGTQVITQAKREATCKPGLLPNSTERSPTGFVYVSLSCEAESVHAFSSFRFVVNGLGYHDSLDPVLTTASSLTAATRR